MAGDALRRRYLCLWMPFLTSDRWRRENHNDETRPLVFASKVKSVSQIAAVDVHARSSGLRPGMALADARARVPALRALSADPIKDEAFIARLADLSLSFTPSVALDPPDGLALDITGCAHLFAGEERLAARLRHVLCAAGVSTIKLAVAATPDMARALARFSSKLSCFVYDDEMVRTLPVAALECQDEDTTALRRAGLKTIADVANRPSLLFTARFSSAFTMKLACVLGEEDRRISPLRKPSPYRAERRCAEPVASHDVITSMLGALAADVRDQLRARGQGGRVFEGTFFRADGAVRRIRVETSRPTRDPDVILRLYRDRLDALADPLDPGFGFDLIRFEALRAEPWGESQASLDAQGKEGEEISGLIDRLGAMLGRERVMRLQPVDSHIPERAQTVVPASASEVSQTWAMYSPHGYELYRPPLLYARPHPIDMETDDNDAPTAFRWRRVKHRIVHSAGPERIAEEWWRAPVGYGVRDYYRVESSEARRFWIFRANTIEPGAAPRWFLHGLFA